MSVCCCLLLDLVYPCERQEGGDEGPVIHCNVREERGEREKSQGLLVCVSVRTRERERDMRTADDSSPVYTGVILFHFARQG